MEELSVFINFLYHQQIVTTSHQRYLMFNLSKKMLLLIVFSCFGALCLQSCARRYSSKSFKILPEKGVTKNNVSVIAHELSTKESYYYFNADVNKTTGLFYPSYPAYQAIQLTIKNDSNEPYVLNSNLINVQLADYSDVTYKIKEENDSDFFSESSRAIRLSKLIKDIEYLTLHQNSTETIAPHNIFNKFIFINKKDATTFLSLDLINQQSGEKIVFNLDL